MSVEWSLKGTNVPIGVSSFEITNTLPKDVLEMLPTEEDINMHVDLEDIYIIDLTEVARS